MNKLRLIFLPAYIIHIEQINCAIAVIDNESRHVVHAEMSIDDNDADHSSKDSQKLRIAKYVKDNHPSVKTIARHFNITIVAVYSAMHDARKAGMLTLEDTDYLRDEKTYQAKITQAVRRKASLNTIYAICRTYGSEWVDNPSESDKKLRLNRIFGVLYQQGKLETKDTNYLKRPKTVIGRRGDTKERIKRFLTDRSSRAPTSTLQALTDEFNASRFSAQRPILRITFTDHVREMVKRKTLSKKLEKFFDQCKDPKQR